MLILGAHLSASKGYVHMLREAQSIGANTFQFFTRNPRGGAVKAQDPADVAAFLQGAQAADFGTVLAHAPYTMNLCSADPSIRQFGKDMLADDLQRMEYTPNQYYNFHPGSHVKQGAEVGIAQIAETLNEMLFPEQTTTVLLETMAGKGSEVGRNFSELRAILDSVHLQEKMGVCLDTCHIWDGGYDIAGNLEAVLEEFDKTIGLHRLYAVHLNDSMNPLGAHKDRHQKIGQGYIGLEALKAVVRHPVLKQLPFILETPNDDAGYAAEIALLRKAAEESN